MVRQTAVVKQQQRRLRTERVKPKPKTRAELRPRRQPSPRAKIEAEAKTFLEKKISKLEVDQARLTGELDEATRRKQSSTRNALVRKINNINAQIIEAKKLIKARVPAPPELLEKRVSDVGRAVEKETQVEQFVFRRRRNIKEERARMIEESKGLDDRPITITEQTMGPGFIPGISSVDIVAPTRKGIRDKISALDKRLGISEKIEKKLEPRILKESKEITKLQKEQRRKAAAFEKDVDDFTSRFFDVKTPEGFIGPSPPKEFETKEDLSKKQLTLAEGEFQELERRREELEARGVRIKERRVGKAEGGFLQKAFETPFIPTKGILKKEDRLALKDVFIPTLFAEGVGKATTDISKTIVELRDRPSKIISGKIKAGRIETAIVKTLDLDKRVKTTKAFDPRKVSFVDIGEFRPPTQKEIKTTLQTASFFTPIVGTQVLAGEFTTSSLAATDPRLDPQKRVSEAGTALLTGGILATGGAIKLKKFVTKPIDIKTVTVGKQAQQAIFIPKGGKRFFLTGSVKTPKVVKTFTTRLDKVLRRPPKRLVTPSKAFQITTDPRLVFKKPPKVTMKIAKGIKLDGKTSSGVVFLQRSGAKSAKVLGVSGTGAKLPKGQVFTKGRVFEAFKFSETTGRGTIKFPAPKTEITGLGKVGKGKGALSVGKSPIALDVKFTRIKGFAKSAPKVPTRTKTFAVSDTIVVTSRVKPDIKGFRILKASKITKSSTSLKGLTQSQSSKQIQRLAKKSAPSLQATSEAAFAKVPRPRAIVTPRVSTRLDVLTTIKPVIIDREEQLSATRTTPMSKQGQVLINKLNEEQVQGPFVDLSGKTKEEQAGAQASRLGGRTKQVPKTPPSEDLGFAPPLITTLFRPPRITTTPKLPRTRIGAPLPLFTFEPSRKGRPSIPYNVFIKKRKIGGNLTKKQALSLGSFAVDNTIAARFKIQKAKGKIKKPKYKFPQNYFAMNSRKFRGFRKKRGMRIPLSRTYIEKQRVRLDKPGEVRQITAARFLANRRRAQVPNLSRTMKLFN